MLKTLRTALAGLLVVYSLTLAWPITAAAPSAKPEDVGLSTERLKRVAELVQRHIAAGSFSGAVALVARNGKVGYHEAFGQMDIEAKKPMVKDGIFSIMSMTKPIIGVATLMMMEEGKVHLQDPISKFIPEWKDMTVGIPLPAAPGLGPRPPRLDVSAARRDPAGIRDRLVAGARTRRGAPRRRQPAVAAPRPRPTAPRPGRALGGTSPGARRRRMVTRSGRLGIMPAPFRP